MYKGLKPELEDVVSRLSIGDGVVIEHILDHFADRTMGYVKNVSGSYLTLTKIFLSLSPKSIM